MYQSYVLFKTDQGNIESAGEDILFYSKKFVRHIMSLYTDGGFIVKFEAPTKDLFEAHINSLELNSFGINETKVLYAA